MYYRDQKWSFNILPMQVPTNYEVKIDLFNTFELIVILL